MINKQFSNPCFRCGKERIVTKQWVEEIPTFGNSTQKVTRSLTACPDAECQKVVDAEIEAQRVKREKVKSDREAKLKKAEEKKKEMISSISS